MTDDEAFVVTRVQRKIEDRSGASLSVALLFFLVCATVGSVLIAAASVSMGRMKGIEQGEQERYAVDSAMELIAEKMEGGCITFQASMDRKDAQVLTEYADGIHEDKIEYLLDSSNDWKLKNLSIVERKNADGDKISDDKDNGFIKFRDEVSQKIFEYYLQKQSVYDSSNAQDKKDDLVILGEWFPSDEKFQELKASLAENETDDIERFIFGTPDSTWPSDSKTADFMYITLKNNAKNTSHLIEEPMVMTVGDQNKLKVNVLFAIDSQFNITAVIYPYNRNPSPDLLKNAAMYRVVMIPCTSSSLTFNPGIKEVPPITTEKKTTTVTSVQHTVKLFISWGEAVRSSVIEDSAEDYPKFFPKQFKDLLLNDTVTSLESGSESDG